MRIAVLVKQVPRAETLELLASGRLKRDGVELEMNAYCRRAVSKGVELAAATGGSCTVFTLGPPSAEDCLREAVAWGADCRGARDRPCLRRFRHPRHGPGDGGGDRGPKARSTSSWSAATRSMPTPGRSRPSSPSCSTCLSPQE